MKIQLAIIYNIFRAQYLENDWR